MLSVIFLFMQDSPFLLLCFLNTLTASYVLHGLSLHPRVPRLVSACVMPAVPSVSCPRLRVFGCIAPAHATLAADSVQRVLYYKTSRAEKIDSAKITGKVLRILREWLLQGLRRLGNAELQMNTPASAPCNNAANTKVQTAKVETVDTP